MLKTVTLKPKQLSAYSVVAGKRLLAEVRAAAKPLQGLRVLHVSATAAGGGVAELLQTKIPLERDAGLDVEWQTIDPPPGFFEVTKKIHNALQGESAGILEQEWQLYESVNRDLAAEIAMDTWDVIVVHDPQPAALRRFGGDHRQTTWVWRCHLDSSTPDTVTANRFIPFLAGYQGAIYSMEQYRLPNFQPPAEAIIAPVIDPLAPKNRPMSTTEANRTVAKHGIDPKRPLITQVSRFDRWKDPLGVISVWENARREVADLQLALVGNTVNDDPESVEILAEVRQAAAGQNGVFIIDNLPAAENDRTVKAFYVASDVVLQKSLREGFGLTVSEALWAEAPVVATPIGGIVLQIESGKSGFLASTIDGATDAVVKLIGDPKLAKRMGKAGHDHVRKQFLAPRLVRDELRFLTEVLGR